jgi:hypothetical protein
MYARGILFGKMKYELGDNAVVRCPETGLEANIEFKVKGWVSGTYNAIGGHISDRSGKHLYELSGFWHGEMFIKDLATGKKEMIFDATHAKPSPIQTRPLEEQGERESQRLWHNTVEAIKRADQSTATEEKSKIEDEQRKEAAARGEGNVWQPKLFQAVPAGDEESLDWILSAHVDGSAPAEKQIEQILAIANILPGQKKGQEAPAQKIEQETNGSSSKAQSIPYTHDIPSQPAIAPNPGGHTATSDPAPEANTTPVPAPSKHGVVTTTADSLPIDRAAAEAEASATSHRPGEVVRRTDSFGNEETFIDAEA